MRLRLLIALAGAAGCSPSAIDPPAADAVAERDAGSADPTTATLPGPRLCADVAPPPIDVDAPLFLYYGAYQRSDQPGELHWPATLALRGSDPTAEAVIATNPADPCARFRPWIEAGGMLAFKMPLSRAVAGERSLEAHLEAGTAVAAIAQRLAEGYAYVAIDELSWAHGPERWFDDGDMAARFVALLDALATLGVDRRVILYVNSYNNAGRLHRFGRVLRACHARCRAVASEVYMHIANVLASAAGVVRAQADPVCTFNLSCLDRLAREMDAISPGINQRAITVLRLDDDGYSDGRLDSLCESSTQLGRRGGLDVLYGRLHAGTFTRQQRGTGGYTPVRVGRHPGWGAIHQALCLRALNAWW